MVFQAKIDVVDRLELALGDGSIPSNYQQWCSHLLTHLRKPLQIGFVGQAQSGKSSLINMILGRKDLPEMKGIDIVEIAYGATPRTSFEHQDGTQEFFDGLIDTLPQSGNPVRARLELPDDALLGQTFVKARLSGTPENQENILKHVARSSAIMVFCSEKFSTAEQTLWSAVPDEIKDHSILAMTMADRQIMKGQLAERMAELEPIVSQEFLGLYPIATLQAIASRSNSATVKPDLWTSSGGRDLYEVLQRQIELGQTEDIDQAGMLLAQFAPQPKVKTMAKVSATVAADTPAPDIARPPDTVGAPGNTTVSKEAKHVLNLLQQCSDEMLGSFSSIEELDPANIINRCVDVISEISGSLEDVDSDDPVLHDMQDNAREGEQMMMLLQLENDEEAATDAVVLLIQLRKEISERTCG